MASVLELHSNKLIGYSFHEKCVIETLENACDMCRSSNEFIFTHRLGNTITSQEFQTLLATHSMKPSFSRKGCLHVS
ncbi:hypothetical protein [Bacillus pseudomycoides]|uniref:hypothetical protein n=1 Tax=Bacillus pseudomycoides TaxID=64104 RepID=UPI000BF0F006|nr:hypothetical protein [Bacillus pseudomycoides]PEK67227.1 hypothetical protein CN590_15145 [Bacillus pseudomycoides]